MASKKWIPENLLEEINYCEKCIQVYFTVAIDEKRQTESWLEDKVLQPDDDPNYYINNKWHSINERRYRKPI